METLNSRLIKSFEVSLKHGKAIRAGKLSGKSFVDDLTGWETLISSVPTDIQESKITWSHHTLGSLEKFREKVPKFKLEPVVKISSQPPMIADETVHFVSQILNIPHRPEKATGKGYLQLAYNFGQYLACIDAGLYPIEVDTFFVSFLCSGSIISVS